MTATHWRCWPSRHRWKRSKPGWLPIRPASRNSSGATCWITRTAPPWSWNRTLALGERLEAEERQRLEQIRQGLDDAQLQEVIRQTLELKRLQEAPDSPEALATIPRLRVEDLDKTNKDIPLEQRQHSGAPILWHDLFTNGIAYLDVSLDLHQLEGEYLPYVPLFGRALVEMGTQSEDYVSFTQRISRKTGGIQPKVFTSMVRDATESVSRLILRSKSMLDQTPELFEILRDVLQGVRLQDRERFRQMVLEEKVRHEQGLVAAGHQIVGTRLRARFNEADGAAEQMGGVNYLFFLRRLARAVDEDWPRRVGCSPAYPWRPG